jgi:hypothetical protein
MKFLNTFVPLVLGISLLTCNKDDQHRGPNQNTTHFVGKWTGTFGYDTCGSGNYFSIRIKQDGVFEELGNTGIVKGAGTWIIEGNTLKASYKMAFSPFNQYTIIAAINSAWNIEGSWGYDNDGTDGGHILLNRQQ